MAKKHYRVGKKQVEINYPKGTFIPNAEKPKLYTLGFVILMLIFLKGILLGYIFGRND